MMRYYGYNLTFWNNKSLLKKVYPSSMFGLTRCKYVVWTILFDKIGLKTFMNLRVSFFPNATNKMYSEGL